MNKLGSIRGMVVVGVALAMSGLAARPAQAIPEATTPTLVGIGLGGELGFAGAGVGSRGLPYAGYISAGVARIVSARLEVFGGAGRPQARLLGAQFSFLPIPLITAVIEPAVISVRGTAGPSIGVRATGSIPMGLRITGYGRAHFVNSRTTTEFGAGVDYPIAPPLSVSLSVVQFNGGFSPAGLMLMAGIKTRLGV